MPERYTGIVGIAMPLGSVCGVRENYGELVVKDSLAHCLPSPLSTLTIGRVAPDSTASLPVLKEPVTPHQPELSARVVRSAEPVRALPILELSAGVKREFELVIEGEHVVLAPVEEVAWSGPVLIAGIGGFRILHCPSPSGRGRRE